MLRELRLYRTLGLVVGVIYAAWWLAVDQFLPDAYNPLPGRLIVVALIWAPVVLSYASGWVSARMRVFWIASLWLLTSHFFYLFYENAGNTDWVIGAFVTVTCVTMGFMSRASLLAYSVFAVGISLAMLIALPATHVLFFPGMLTVVLQANIGLNSRLAVMRNLEESNAHFELLFNSTLAGVMIHEDGKVVQVNDALTKLLELPSKGVVGSEAARWLTSKTDALFGDAVAEVEHRRADGERVDLEIHARPFMRGERRQRMVTFIDITERKRRTEQLREANKALADTNLDLRRFAYVASHDLQTPLRSIASFVELLGTTYGPALDAQANDWIARAGGSAKHLQTLIGDLLEYSRIDAEPRAFKPVAMTEVLDRVRSLVEVAAREANATITADELPEVVGDRSQLVQLVLNLVSNALKYRAAEPPRIHLAVEDRDNDWLFGIRDNGIGIAPKYHQQIFEVFKRLHDQKTYPGTGIGLAICRGVVERHGGSIWVESHEGGGSRFLFTIPKVEAA